jgi:hypothetical protein
MQHILYIDDSGTKEFTSGAKGYTRQGGEFLTISFLEEFC